MSDAISNTSPLLYLYRVNGLHWLHGMFGQVWIPSAVIQELEEGKQKGIEVPILSQYHWLLIRNARSIPSAWLASDLGAGELATIALALENPDRVVLLDDLQARRIAQAAGLTVWGTLKVVLEAKTLGMIERVDPIVQRMRDSGMWFSEEIRQRILVLADEQTD